MNNLRKFGGFTHVNNNEVRSIIDTNNAEYMRRVEAGQPLGNMLLMDDQDPKVREMKRAIEFKRQKQMT